MRGDLRSKEKRSRIFCTGRLYYAILAVFIGFLLPVSAWAQEIAIEQLQNDIRKAIGASQLDEKTNVSFKVLTIDSTMEQEVLVTVIGPDLATLKVAERDSTLYVKNGENYFVKTPNKVVDILDESSQKQIDAFIDLLDFTRLIDWSSQELETKSSASENGSVVKIIQGTDKNKVELTVDQKSSRVVMIARPMFRQGSLYNTTTYIDEYLKLNDVEIPSRLRTVVHNEKGEERFTQIISDLRFDKNLPIDTFKATKTKRR